MLVQSGVLNFYSFDRPSYDHSESIKVLSRSDLFQIATQRLVPHTFRGIVSQEPEL